MSENNNNKVYIGEITAYVKTIWFKDGSYQPVSTLKGESMGQFDIRYSKILNVNRGDIKNNYRDFDSLQVEVMEGDDDLPAGEEVRVKIGSLLTPNKIVDIYPLNETVEFVKKETKSGAYYYELVK